LANQKSKRKPSKFSQLTFATEVGRFVSEHRPAMDFVEGKIAAEADTLELFAKGEQLGINRATMFRWILSERALGTSDELVIAVFEASGLDPTRPLHWKVLFGALIETGFKRNGGRPTEWDELAYYDFFTDIKKLQVLQPSLDDDSKIAKGLLENKAFAKRYRDRKVDYLRKKVAEAKKMFDGITPGATFEQFVAEYRAKKYGLSLEVVQEFVDRMWSQTVEDVGFDPDKVLAILDEAEKQAARIRRQQIDYLKRPKETD